MIKFTILLRHRPELTRAEFVEYHRRRHAPLFTSLPVVQDTVRRYVQQHTLDASLPGLPPTTIDGITELWFDDVESVARLFTDPSYLEIVRPDEEKFLDLHGCEFILSTENPVLP